MSRQSLVLSFFLSSPFESTSGFYQLKVQGWIIQLLAALHVPLLPASRGGFYGEWEGGTPETPLGSTVQSSGKIVRVFPLPLHHLSWYALAYFQ